jgi:hypothetical protein
LPGERAGERALRGVLARWPVAQSAHGRPGRFSGEAQAGLLCEVTAAAHKAMPSVIASAR